MNCTDDENDLIDFTIETPDGEPIDWLDIDGDGVISGDPAESHKGPHEVIIVIDDGFGGILIVPVNLTV